MSRVGIPLRLRAARHETRCRECRVTWGSWVERLVGLSRGYSPRPRREVIALCAETHEPVYQSEPGGPVHCSRHLFGTDCRTAMFERVT